MNNLDLYKNNSGNFELRSGASIWTNQTYRNNGAPCVDRINIKLTLTTSQLDSNLYGLLYTELKTKYSSTTDV